MPMKDYLQHWLQKLGFESSELAYVIAVIIVIAVTTLLIHWVLHRVVLRFLRISAKESGQVWTQALYRRRLFTRLVLTLQGIIVFAQARLWLDSDAGSLAFIEIITHLWILLFGLLSLFSLLNTFEDIAITTESGRRLPLRGLFQGLKLVGAIVVLIFALSLLIGKSPLILFSGLGAMTAILLLIFKDPILGLVAGIQLSANKMLNVGDWLEMPKYEADGEVIDISLTTVKIRNWDKTITTIPTYALISDSFKNWRGMSESGGRRIKRAIYIDATSVHFLSEQDKTRLHKSQLISDYMEQKGIEIDSYNRKHNIDTSLPVIGRRLTNLGTFRAYLTAYLKANSNIHSDMTQMVRHLQPGADGIPIEIYAFTNNTEWLAYENIQADIFDHIFAVLPEFDLRVYQSPTGYDLQQLGKSFQGKQ
jgi:miniconductance mechanosensitive channel